MTNRTNLARSAAAILVAAVFSSPLLAQGPARWESVSDGLPGDASPSWPEIQSFLCTDAVATVSGTGFVMRIDNTSPCPDDLLVFNRFQNSPTTPFPPEFWVEALARVVQSGNVQPDVGAGVLYVRRNNSCGWLLELDTGEAFLTWNGVRMGTHALDTSVMHRYRLASDSMTEEARLFVDGVEVLSGLLPGPPCITDGSFSTQAFFGNLRASEPAVTEWSEVRTNISEGDGRFCDLFATFNSTGSQAALTPFGSRVIAQNDLEIGVDGLPPASFGIFLVSAEPSSLPVASGAAIPLCLGSPVGRLVGPGQIQQASVAGTVRMSIDLTQLPQGSGFVGASPGESWAFQYWYRDVGPVTSGLSEGLELLLR